MPAYLPNRRFRPGLQLHLLLTRNGNPRNQQRQSRGQAVKRLIRRWLQIAAAGNVLEFRGRIGGLQIVGNRNNRKQNDSQQRYGYQLQSNCGKKGSGALLPQTNQPPRDKSDGDDQPNQVGENFNNNGRIIPDQYPSTDRTAGGMALADVPDRNLCLTSTVLINSQPSTTVL